MPLIDRIEGFATNSPPSARDLHAHPEIGSKEKSDLRHCRREADAMGHRGGIAGSAATGVIGVLRARAPAASASACAPT